MSTTKTKTIVLRPSRSFHTEHTYVVVQVTDSVEFAPGESVSKKQVQDLCAARDWRVTVKEGS